MKLTKKKEKSLHKRLNAKIWKLFSYWIRERDGYKCFTCDKLEKPGQAGHRYHGALDYDVINVNNQCTHCNKWLHGNLGEYERRLRIKYGDEAIEDLRTRAKQIWKPSTQELEDLLAHWTDEVEKINKGS